MSNKGLKAVVALTPEGVASVQTGVVPKLEIHWTGYTVTAYLDEDPKNKIAYERLMIADAVALAFSKALVSNFEIADDDYRIIQKVLGDWEQVFTGENILFYVDWVREFTDLVESSDAYSLSLSKPLSEGLISGDSSSWSFQAQKSDAVYSSDDETLSTNLGKSDGVTSDDSQDLDTSLVKSDSSSVSDDWDRVVEFDRVFNHPAPAIDLSYWSFSTGFADLQSVIDEVIVGLVYDKFFDSEARTEIWGDPLGFGMLGEYTVNHSDGGEFLYLGLLKPLSSSTTESDVFNRVVNWYPDYDSSVTMVDQGEGDGLVYEAEKVVSSSAAPSDSYSDVIAYLRSFASSSAPIDTSATAVLTSSRSIPGTLNEGLLNNLTLNNSSSVTFITEYTLI
jgi:hypothetical protein